MTSHNSKLVSAQQKAREMNAAVSAALAVVREQGVQCAAKDGVIAALRVEVEAELGGDEDVALSGLRCDESSRVVPGVGDREC